MSGTALFARVSTVQGERDTAGSVAQQVEACHALARQNGWEVSPDLVFTEEVSATRDVKRPGFEALCAAVASGRVARVVVWSTERIVRRMSDLETYVTACEPYTVTTHPVVSTPLDLSNPTGLMVARITVAVASFEVEQLKGRISRGLQTRAEAGLPVGGRVPFGFLPDRVTHHPVEAEAIRTGTRAILAGESVRSVARAWNEAGLRTRTGKEFSPTQVRSVLTRPRNAGFVQRRGERGNRAQWDPIVTVSEWDALRALLSDPSRRKSPGPQPTWLLSFVARCECGGFVKSWRSGYDRRGNTRISYRCTVTERTEPHPTIPAHALDEYVTEKLIQGYWEQGYSFATATVDVSGANDSSEREDIERRRGFLVSEYAGGRLTDDQYRSAMDTLDLRAEQLTSPTPRIHADQSAETLEKLRAEWEGFSIDRKRDIVRDTVDVTIHRSGAGNRVSISDRVTLGWKFDTFQV